MLMIVVKLFICDYCYFRLAWIHIQRRWDVSSEIWGQSLKGLGTTFKWTQFLDYLPVLSFDFLGFQLDSSARSVRILCNGQPTRYVVLNAGKSSTVFKVARNWQFQRWLHRHPIW
jgi:hypothetical protein